MKTFQTMLAGCAALLAASAPADAVVRSLAFNLSASSFAEIGGSTVPAPVDPLHLGFSLTFDDAVDTADGVSAGLTVTSSNLPGSRPLRYTYLHDVGYGDTLIVGTDVIPYGACTTSGSSIDHTTLCAFLSNVTGATPLVDYLAVGTARYEWDAGQAQLLVTAGAVPEPAGWAMMVLGFGMIGIATRRRPITVSGPVRA